MLLLHLVSLLWMVAWCSLFNQLNFNRTELCLTKLLSMLKQLRLSISYSEHDANCFFTGSLNLLHLDVTVCNFDRSLINAPGPCVLFATPGMISGGFSLEVFKQWAPSEENLVTLPGYIHCDFAY